ncbi:hypothetical protein TRFO_15943 [Tritrichomonas foetus]|uniref:Ankyrin repeat protein n=1 Tax=Tritrichomonas foetus TaxID=1144522 RepID=A0A1J4KWB7_9EUKA|nr:hypothetical protein TRFO_15943 [Tritrichomonas foetus]|eukprot:OHT13821.1 hypothetical protein TRFO_15943 [Tritrichomonas foetus]
MIANFLNMFESNLIDALRHDTPDILISWLPNDDILKYCFSSKIPLKDQFLLNCPPIHCVAAYLGSIQCLQLLYDRGDRFKTKDNNSKTIVDFTFTGGHFESFNFLITHGFDPNDLLKQALIQDNINAIKFFHENDIFEFNFLLFKVAEFGCIEMMNYLIKVMGYKKIMNSRNDDGNSVLHISIENSKIQMLKHLFNHEETQNNDEINIKNENDINESKNIEDVDFNPINLKTGQSLLHLAAKKNNSEILNEILSEHGINTSQEHMWDFMTMDFLAVENDVRRKASIRSQNKVHKHSKPIDFNQKDNHGNTPLMIAVKEGGLSVIQAFLMNEGLIDINIVNKKGQTALIEAVIQNRAEVVAILIEIDGIDPNVLSKDGMAALHLACVNKNEEIVSLLLKLPTININIQSNQPKETQENQENKNGAAPLHFAVESGNINIFNDLLTFSNLKFDLLNEENMTPLQIAAREGHKEMLLKLLECGCSQKFLTATDINGLTPLHSAARFGHFEICQKIIELSKNNLIQIDVNQKDNDGWTALHYASRNAHLEIIKLLLEIPGIDVNSKDNRGNTALYFTMNQEIRLLLQGHGAR